MTHGAVRWYRCRLATSGWICGTNWIELAPVPTTATRSPLEIVLVVPSRRVEEGAVELAKAGNVGQLRLVQRPGTGDQNPCGQRTARGLEAPAPGLGDPSGRSRPRTRTGCARAAPPQRPCGAGSRGSRPAGRTSRSIPGSARRRTSRRGLGRRNDSPGYVFSRQVPPTSRARSKITKSSRPERFNRLAIASPEKPEPMIAISVL